MKEELYEGEQKNGWFPNSPYRGNRATLLFIALLLAISTGEGIFLLISQTLPSSSPLPKLPDKPSVMSHTSEFSPVTIQQCGSSPAEAREAGCIFDELSFAWQVPGCYDTQAIEGFKDAYSGKYYTDENGTAVVPQWELELDHQLVHVPWRFHIVHCMYLRRQMLRAWWGQRPMDSHLANYKHTVHCGNTMLDTETDLENLHTAAPVIYPVCQPYQDWVKEANVVQRSG